MKKALIIAVWSCLVLQAIAMNENYLIKPKIKQVFDGDTIQIRTKQDDVSVRLYGIDCYETLINIHINYQKNDNISYEEIIEKGKQAKLILQDIIKNNKNIHLEIIGMDKKYGRLVGTFYYKDDENKFVNINKLMQKTGFCPAYTYKPHS